MAVGRSRSGAAGYERALVYLPSTLLGALVRRPDGPSTFIEPTDGTMVFADISGFTPLSEALAATGREGAERLTTVLNDFFTRQLRIASEWGGSNQKFGGDAMLLLFSGPDHARRAVEAGLAMQRETARFPAIDVSAMPGAPAARGGKRLRLSMSIGMHSGRFWSAAVGDPDIRMQHVILGGDGATVAEVEHAATSGQVVVSTSTLDLLDGAFTVEPLDRFHRIVARRGRRPVPPAPRFHKEVPAGADLLAYLPPPLARALAAGDAEGRVEDEHRRVVVLFVSVRGLNRLLDDFGPERALHEAQALVAGIAGLTARHGGFISGNDIDGNGLKLIVLFGAPVAQEDDAASALRLAADVAEHVRSLGLALDVRTGVNAGYVFAGDVGSPIRRDYTVIGDAVNLAARLMGSAGPGEVVVADWVAAEAGAGFDLRAARQIRVKGKSMPIPVHTLAGLRSEHDDVVPERAAGPLLVGREGEQRLLRNLADEVLASGPRAVLVTGEAGQGQTVLVSDLLLRLADDGWRTVLARCRPHLREVPLAPWRAVLDRLLAVPADLAGADRTGAVLAALADLDPALVPWASLLNTALDVDVAPSALVRSLDPAQLADRLVSLVADVVTAAARRGATALVVDGVHQADRASLRVLERLARSWEKEPLLVVATTRTDAAADLDLPPETTSALTLHELGRDHADVLARRLLAREDAPRALLDAVYQRAKGNPLMTEEVVRALVSSGVVDELAGLDPRRQAELLAAVDVPDRLQQLVMARIDRLDPVPRRVLRQASVVGQSFEQQTVRALVQEDSPGVSTSAALQQLVAVGLLAPEEGARGSFSFRHETVREVAYGSMLFSTRRRLHRRVASHLEQRHGTDLDRLAGVLAGHYRAAGDLPRCGHFALRAGDHALRSYAVEDAEASFHLAEDVLARGDGSTATRSLVAERLGDCLDLAGRPGEAAHWFQLARRRWRHATVTGPQPDELRARGERVEEHEARLCHKAAQSYHRADQYRRALTWLDRAEEALPPRAARLRAEIVVSRCAALWRQGRYAEAVEVGTEGLRQARRVRHERLIAYAQDMVSGAYLELGQLRHAIRHREEAVRIYEREGDLRGLMGGHNNLGAAHQLLGELDEALASYHLAAEYAERLGNRPVWAVVRNNIGEVHLVRGQLAQAAQEFELAVGNYDTTGQGMVWAGLALVNLSRVRQREGDLEQAQGLLDRGAALLRKANARGLLLEASWQRVVLLVAGGDLTAAARANARFLADAQALGMQLFEVRSKLLDGRIALATGDRGTAEVVLREVRAEAERLGARQEEAEALVALAEAGVDRRRALRAARARFASIGAEVEVARLEALLQDAATEAGPVVARAADDA